MTLSYATFNETDAVIAGVNGTLASYKCTSPDGKKWVRDCKYEVKDQSKPSYVFPMKFSGFGLFLLLVIQKSI
jgi:hypothetical protein